MSYFQAVRLYSLVEVCIFTALLVTAIGGLGEDAELILGWTHGIGWIILCLLVAYGAQSAGTSPGRCSRDRLPARARSASSVRESSIWRVARRRRAG